MGKPLNLLSIFALKHQKNGDITYYFRTEIVTSFEKKISLIRLLRHSKVDVEFYPLHFQWQKAKVKNDPFESGQKSSISYR